MVTNNIIKNFPSFIKKKKPTLLQADFFLGVKNDDTLYVLHFMRCYTKNLP